MLGIALQAVDRGEVADGAAALREHVSTTAGSRRTGPDVDVKERVELFGRDSGEGHVEGNAGVVDQAVDPAQEVDGLLGQVAGPRRRREVGLEGGGRRPMA